MKRFLIYVTTILCIAFARNPFLPTPESLINAKIQVKIIYLKKNNYIALLEMDKQSKLVHKGTKIGNFTVSQIAKDYVILNNNKLSVKIYIGD